MQLREKRFNWPREAPGFTCDIVAALPNEDFAGESCTFYL
jgi:hypothetical protein